MMRNVTLVLSCACLTVAASYGAPTRVAPKAQQTEFKYLFQDPDVPGEKRIENLVSLMTLDEKISCLSTTTSIPRLGIRGTGHMEGIHGLSLGGPRTNGRANPTTTTMFPQGIGLGETWDATAIHEAASAEGYEARYIYNRPSSRVGSLIVMSPNADIGRDPRWGRTEECYGEDAFLNGTLVTAFVKGLQGDDPKYWQAASLLKHFLANSTEDAREASSSNFDERLWREYYSVPFEMGIVEGGSRAFMAAYNAYNGIPCGVNPMLKDITVNEWGNDGIICTDGGAVRLMISAAKYYPDMEHAVAGTIKAGITKYLENARTPVQDAINHGLIQPSDLDEAMKSNLRILLHLGLLDPPDRVAYSKIGGPDAPWLSDKHKAVARKVTQESIVLLKNTGKTLPLDRARIKSVAVIGPWADSVLLDWYSGVPPYRISPLAGIKAKVGPGVTVTFADGKDPAEVARVAKASDVAIVCIGNNPVSGMAKGWGKVDLPSEGREAVDRKVIDLEQEALVKQVYAANSRTVAVLISSFPYSINWTQEHVPAIVHMAHGSQEEGNALADVLFGDYNPAGRTVQTWPRSLNQLPTMQDYDIRHGRTYMYFNGVPLYPFGFGLSYTTFALSNLRTASNSVAPGGTVKVTVDVRNTGRLKGDEVVQLYVKHVGSKVTRPKMELRGFNRVALEPGEKKTVTMTIPASKLAYWDAPGHRWVLEGDRVQLLVGDSSVNLRLRRTVRVEAGTYPARVASVPDLVVPSLGKPD